MRPLCIVALARRRRRLVSLVCARPPHRHAGDTRFSCLSHSAACAALRRRFDDCTLLSGRESRGAGVSPLVSQSSRANRRRRRQQKPGGVKIYLCEWPPPPPTARKRNSQCDQPAVDVAIFAQQLSAPRAQNGQLNGS